MNEGAIQRYSCCLFKPEEGFVEKNGGRLAAGGYRQVICTTGDRVRLLSVGRPNYDPQGYAVGCYCQRMESAPGIHINARGELV